MRYLLLLGLLGCAFEPPNEQPLFNPLYRQWFSELERCVQHTGDYDRIQWFVADLASEGLRGHLQGDNIWIDRDYVNEEGVVKHEELHYLIGDPEHTRPEWRMQCL